MGLILRCMAQLGGHFVESLCGLVKLFTQDGKDLVLPNVRQRLEHSFNQ